MRALFVSFILCVSVSSLADMSPYVEQADDTIKSLTPEDVEGYVNGRGMGLAKAAELNGYPGPKHVLELADKLDLTTAQRESTQQLFESMAESARPLGIQLVDLERQLDQAFASTRVTTESLAALTAEISRLQGELRAVHLSAHLKQRSLLSEHQRLRYVQLRGFHLRGSQPGH
jgi:hypothetical protein